MVEIENQVLTKKINDDRIFEPKIQEPLDNVIEILDVPDPELKKTMFPYVEPTVQTPEEIEETQKLIEDDFIDLQTKFDKVNNVATEQKKQKKIEDIIDTVIDEKSPFNSFDNFWWEDDLFNKKDPSATVNASKKILDDIHAISDNILRNIRPVDNRTIEELVADDFIPIDYRTQQELEDDDYASLESDLDDKVTLESDSELEQIDTTSAWDPKKTQVTRPGKIIKFSTDYNKKVKAVTKIKNKYLRKKIGERNKNNKTSAE